MKQALIFLIIWVLLASRIVSPSYAQDASLSISPTLLEIESSRPSLIEKNINLKNMSRSTITLTIQLIPFTQSVAENGEAELLFDKTQAQETQQFIRKSAKIFDGNEQIDSIILSPLQEKNLMLSINLEKNEKISDHYFSIVFIKKPDIEVSNNSKSTHSNILPGISTNVIFSISAPVKRAALIEDFKAPVFVNSGPVPFTVVVKNNLSKYIKPYGNIVIKNMIGQTIGKIDLKPSAILSNTKRKLISDSLPQRTNNSKIPNTFAYWNESLLLGLYSAKLRIVAGPDAQIVSRTIYFIGFPINYMLGLSVSILLFIFILGKIREKRNK